MNEHIQTDHDSRVQAIAERAAELTSRGVAYKIYRGTTNSTRIQEFHADNIIDVSQMSHILSINTASKTVVVEPNVSMDALVRATLKHGLVPPVITEFPGITVGGGIQGGAGESSSFKWGFLSQTALKMEYVLADGTVMVATPDDHQDLFWGSAGSSGTLGILTSAELQLVEAHTYVQITYHQVSGFQHAVDTIRQFCSQDYDFIDAVLYSSSTGVVITGKMTDEVTGTLQRLSRRQDPWFYLHAREHSLGSIPYVYTTPLQDYLFRYDRGAFWMGTHAFRRLGVPFYRLTRYMLDPLLHTRKLYQALQSSGASQEYFLQDLTVAQDKTVSLLQYIDAELQIYPLWLCPILPEPRSPLMCNGIAADLAINIGVWGGRNRDITQLTEVNRRVENYLSSLGGKKWTYGHFYYTPEEYWQVYDRNWYDALRHTYHAETLPDIYTKLHVNKQHPISTKRGVYNALFKRNRLPIKR